MAKPATSYGVIPSGVEVRPGKRGDTLRIVFQFRGVRCREKLDVMASRENIKYAKNLLGEINNAIAHKKFEYRNYFPKSKRALMFGFAMTPDITLGELLDEYLSIAEATLSPSTVRGYKEVTAAHLRPRFGKVLAKDLTAAMLRAWLKTLNVTHKRVKNILCPLSNVLKQAVTDELIDSNPLDKIILVKVLPKINKSDYEVDPFDAEEIRAILGACTTVEEKSMWQFAFTSGLRTSEMISLRWQDIDWLRHEISINKVTVDGFDGPVEKKETKTKSSKRMLPLLPGALDAINAMKPISYMAQDHIFTHPVTRRSWRDDAHVRESSWRRIIRNAGVRYRNPYQTRHTFATTLLMGGESEMLVAELLGHTTTEMVRRNYARWIKSVSRMPRGDYSGFGTEKNKKSDLGQTWGNEGNVNQRKSKARKISGA
ncbi:site-specific integrase [Methylovorus mays]|uniref:site-specific integrase n=1 Tax=Methylovorus mays TaxID=184077 RepID=UPI001E5C171D|nr:site-specific integrase [Methylovorus mays]MCB5206093.1 site-specific integrase [Methylovorus mays]